jgi:hypothetical protein
MQGLGLCVTTQLKHWVSFTGHHGVVAEGPFQR